MAPARKAYWRGRGRNTTSRRRWRAAGEQHRHHLGRAGRRGDPGGAGAGPQPAQPPGSAASATHRSLTSPAGCRAVAPGHVRSGGIRVTQAEPERSLDTEGGCHGRRGQAMTKLMHRAVSMLVGMVGGLLAGAIFKRAWQLAAGEDEAPKATDASRGWHEILIAAALQGAIFATVRAAVDRL